MAEPSKQRREQLFLEIVPLENAFYLTGKERLFLHHAEREILHILMRTAERLGERESTLLSRSLVRKSSQSSGTWREL